MHGSHGLHHLHKRKRVFLKKEQYPHPKKSVRYLDYAVYVVGFLCPILTLPQVIQIYSLRDAAGVSLITWGFYLIAAFIWLVYGVVHREKPIMISNALWIIFDALIVAGVIIY